MGGDVTHVTNVINVTIYSQEQRISKRKGTPLSNPFVAKKRYVSYV